MFPRRINLTATRTDWHAPAGEFAALPGKRIEARCQVIGVDPFTTSPNVVVGINLDESDMPIYLRPGESITLPKPVYRFRVFNPLISQLRLANAAVTPIGMVGLVVGGVGDLVAWKVRANRARPSPAAAIIGLERLTALTATALWVPCAGLEKMRIMVVPVDGTDVFVDPLPADLAGTIRVHEILSLAQTVASANIWDRAACIGPIGPDTGKFPIISDTQCIAPDTASDFAIGQYQTIMDYEVGAGQVAGIVILNLAGTGVDSAIAVVTGV